MGSSVSLSTKPKICLQQTVSQCVQLLSLTHKQGFWSSTSRIFEEQYCALLIDF
jgi:hypothetical protein